MPQPLEIVALDGVPAQFPRRQERKGRTVTQTDIALPPSARAEFIITGPPPSVKNAVLQTLRVPTGPEGDNHPERPLIAIQTSSDASEPSLTMPGVSDVADTQRIADLADEKPSTTRHLYFSEVLVEPNNPLGPTNFYLTVQGATPTLFTPQTPPAIVTTQGSVEDWTIENRATENHAFHIHNLHFLVVAMNGVPLPRDQQEYLDVINLPFWTGTGPFPSVTVRMDFRGADVGDLFYECDYLFHADFGMRALVRVLPKREE